eukprot:TRINITY_DN11808_c0_g1_i1.p1 TRINITY_DN11808_c0_g1~~TRINITY_DN11808_c0_g1_i1.p1  ORF type:complete len:477 (+),score=101.83 TRINITY_DN11808_c0_g1_i1:69-1499(+)
MPYTLPPGIPLGDQQRLDDPQKQRPHSKQQSSPAKTFQDMRRVSNEPLLVGQRPLGGVAGGLPNDHQMSTSRVPSSKSGQHAGTAVPVGPVPGSAAAGSSAASLIAGQRLWSSAAGGLPKDHRMLTSQVPSSTSGQHAGTAVPVGPVPGSAAAGSSAASLIGKAERKRNKRVSKDPQRSLSAESTQDQDALAFLKWQLEMGHYAEAAEGIRGHVLGMTLGTEGSCRIVQLALKILSPHDAADLAMELKGNVCQAAMSIHGNHVLQCIIELLPATKWEFLVVELAEHCVEIAKNVYGCRVFCRLAEQAILSQEWKALVESILQETESLARHPYGRFVVQSLLEYGTEEQKHRLAMAVLANLSALAQNRNASHVVDKALVYCSNADREQLAMGLLYDNRREGEETGLSPLVKTQFGGYVVKALVAMSGWIAGEARRQLTLIAAKQFKDNMGSKDFRIAERLFSELQITPVKAEYHFAA